jgi:hypothetical protein
MMLIGWKDSYHGHLLTVNDNNSAVLTKLLSQFLKVTVRYGLTLKGRVVGDDVCRKMVNFVKSFLH